MAYQTGTAASPIDLVQKMAAWLVSIGWTQDMSQADGAGWRLHLHKGAIYVHLNAAMAQNVWQGGQYTAHAIHLYLSSAFDGGQPWYNQPGNPPIGSGQAFVVGVSMPLMNAGAIQNYYFFSDAADNVLLAVERTAGLIVHLGWGPSLSKTGTWNGGPYFFGSTNGYTSGYGEYIQPAHPTPGFYDSSSCPGADGDYFLYQNCYVLIDVDSFTGKWVGFGGNNTGAGQGYTGKFGRGSVVPAQSFSPEYSIPTYGGANPVQQPFYDLQTVATSQMDGRANLLPVLLWVKRDIGELSLVGTIPNIFSANGVGQGFSNASEYVIGTTTYKMFPNFAVIKQ